MEVEALRAFLGVARHGSFSAAAQALHLTQPAVSKRVAGLEGQLGTRLFDRVGRRVELTTAGRALLPRAEAVLRELEDARRAILDLAGGVAGRLSLGTSHHIGLHRLPPVLRAYTARYPAVELDLHFLDSEAACRGVARGDLELGIVTLPPQPPPRLSLEPVWDDPLSLVVAPGHPLAGLAAPRPADLGAFPAILPGPGTYTRELLEAALAPLGIRLRPGPSTNYLETLKMMVAVGLGWSALPDTLLDAGLHRLSLPELHLSRTLGVVCHTGRNLSNAARALLEVLEETRTAAPAPGS